MVSYNVKRVEHLFSWQNVEAGKINVFNWERFTGYDPEAEFQMVHDSNNIYLKLTAHRDHIVSECTNINDIVCNDSCMEAFIIVPGKSRNYYNFEFNSDGVLHLGMGESRFNRLIVDPELIKKYVTIFAESDKISRDERGHWSVTAIINKKLFEELSGKAFENGRGSGSFYKCGEHVVSHFIAWNEIKTDHPDFHRPEFFGELIFE